MQNSFFNAHLLHQNPDNKKTDETDVCHTSHNFFNFKTTNHAIKVTYTKCFCLMMLFLDYNFNRQGSSQAFFYYRYLVVKTQT